MQSQIHILFVDDEPNVLAALKRMLRAKHDEWAMDFIESGSKATRMLEEKTYDVIISDIRMPGMDGAELLTRVKEKYPGIIRIALSGQVDLNEVIRSIRAVHQYISKPCEADNLIEKIEGALLSRSVLTDETMLNLVTEIESLPVIPRVFQEIQLELNSKAPSIDKIASFITQDVGLVAKILNLVNSPFFGLPSHIASVHQAITMLGLETIESLVLSTHLFSMYDESTLPNFNLTLLWEHCFRVSNIARLIAECEGEDRRLVTQCRMAGLLHDVGKLILASYFPDKYGAVLNIAATKGGPVYDLERKVYKTSHAEVGAYLMGLWGVSPEVVHGIGYHHSHNKMDRSLTMYLSVANIIDHNFVVFNDDYVKIKLKSGLAPIIHDESKMLKWLKYLEDHWFGVGEFYSADPESIKNMLTRSKE
ncbi:response regulator [Pseudodesulfovibrio piezophilus]|uniref:Putative signal transduction protein n=1 Tax=Pseudodesulfovibrio piezophilus (strain DSM 21447 / JCM 15486 / C1TLV30) TaxID=1322246 RepID=M1WQV8_PSEP2|nr:response regulator [Pseudodesulfovibrio piezophilus]CCH47902.1 putative signal transduction protein [Pseudodesulfovibrio piezophilus C1TLV30]